MTGKKSLILYFSWVDAIVEMPGNDAIEVLKAIRQYAEFETVPEFSSAVAKTAFGFIKQQLATDIESWRRQCELKAEGGRKGMHNRYHKPE